VQLEMIGLFSPLNAYRSLRLFFAKLIFTHCRTCQSASWFSWKKFVISPSRLISYFRSTLVIGQAFTTSGVRWSWAFQADRC